MANAAQNAPKLQIGKLTPEEAERLASTFRPIWDLDDAPFAQGGGLSAADVDALSAGAGVTPSVRGTEQDQQSTQGGTYEIRSAPPPRVPAPDEPKVEIAAEAPKPAPRPYTPPQAPPTPVRVSAQAAASGEFVPVKKSNTGIVLIGVGAIALIGILVGVHSLTSSGPKGSSTTAATATATAEPTQTATTAIPPPPPESAAAAQPQPQPEPQATEQHTEPAPPAPTHETPPAPTHVAVQPPVHHATTPHHTTTHATGHATTHHSGGHATIVRDNPF
jgi:hypothetical protein